MYEIGKVYNRRADIHDPFGGQQQGGISTPANHPYIFLFTGDTGEQYGYSDGLDSDGVFIYTGEGQHGDMSFDRGNRATRDHVANGKELHLFEALGHGGNCRYLGEYACSTWDYRRGKDFDGVMRQVIVFHLIPIQAAGEVESAPITPIQEPIDKLRESAYKAATAAAEGKESSAKKTYYERSEAVRRYVLARADGVCEACRKPAPFTRKDGSSYLEPHHTRRVSDGGPDHPRWVGAICPNCHREIHSGQNGRLVNERLQEYLAETESVGL
jgi:5-methylcytosine-specific restriction protein A